MSCLSNTTNQVQLEPERHQQWSRTARGSACCYQADMWPEHAISPQPTHTHTWCKHPDRHTHPPGATAPTDTFSHLVQPAQPTHAVTWCNRPDRHTHPPGATTPTDTSNHLVQPAQPTHAVNWCNRPDRHTHPPGATAPTDTLINLRQLPQPTHQTTWYTRPKRNTQPPAADLSLGGRPTLPGAPPPPPPPSPPFPPLPPPMPSPRRVPGAKRPWRGPPTERSHEPMLVPEPASRMLSFHFLAEAAPQCASNATVLIEHTLSASAQALQRQATWQRAGHRRSTGCVLERWVRLHTAACTIEEAGARRLYAASQVA